MNSSPNDLESYYFTLLSNSDLMVFAADVGENKAKTKNELFRLLSARNPYRGRSSTAVVATACAYTNGWSKNATGVPLPSVD